MVILSGVNVLACLADLAETRRVHDFALMWTASPPWGNGAAMYVRIIKTQLVRGALIGSRSQS